MLAARHGRRDQNHHHPADRALGRAWGVASGRGPWVRQRRHPGRHRGDLLPRPRGPQIAEQPRGYRAALVGPGDWKRSNLRPTHLLRCPRPHRPHRAHCARRSRPFRALRERL